MIDIEEFKGLDKIIDMNNKDIIQRVLLIPLEQIETNDKNFYKLSLVDELVESIRINGLYNPIIVYQENEKYKIVSGHQRYNAYKNLNKKVIKAIVVDKFETLEEEEIAIIETNRQRRKTKEEKYEEIRKIKAHYTKLKNNGNKKYKNININKLTAEAVGVSSETVKKVTSKTNKKEKVEAVTEEKLIDKEVKKIVKSINNILSLEIKLNSEFLSKITDLLEYTEEQEVIQTSLFKRGNNENNV